MEKYLLIPDVHGHYDLAAKLQDLYDFSEIRAVFIGDFIDKGEGSNKVIGLIREIGAIAILGNHEWVTLNALSGDEGSEFWRHEIWRSYESGMLSSYGIYASGKLDRDAEALKAAMTEIGDWGFLNSLPPFFEHDDFIAVHAGLEPDVAWEQQQRLLLKQAEPANRTAHEPPQIFDYPKYPLALQRSLPLHVTEKLVVSGHAHLRAGLSERRGTNRLRLASSLRRGDPLFVWESWSDQIRIIEQA